MAQTDLALPLSVSDLAVQDAGSLERDYCVSVAERGPRSGLMRTHRARASLVHKQLRRCGNEAFWLRARGLRC